MRVKDVIFDLDGTLTDSLELCYVAFRDAFSRFIPRSFTDEEIRATFGPSEEGVAKKMVPDHWEECLEAFLAYYQKQHANYVQVFPGIYELLDWLKSEGARIGLVTGKGPCSTAITLSELGLDKYMDAVECGSPSGPVKPAALRRVLATWEVSARDVAYVGDVPSDMRAAIEVGTLPLGAGWASSAREEALTGAGAVRVFSSPELLHRWLLGEDEQ